MGDSLVDLGDGVKILNPANFVSGAQDPTERLTKQLGLVNLIGTIEDRKIKRIQEEEDRPFEKAKKEADARLAENNVSNIEFDNDRMRQELNMKQMGEQREQTKFFIENTGKAIELFKQNPNLGASALNMVVPGGIDIEDHQDGTYTATSKKSGGKIYINPNKIDDPEKRRAFESQQRDDFTKSVAPFQAASDNYKNIIELSKQKPAKEKAGLRDLSMLVNFVKLINPNARVNEESVDQFDGTEGILGQIGSLATQAKSGKRLDQDQIDNLLDSAKIHYKTKYDDAISKGQFFYQGAKIQGLDPRLIIQPAGGLSYDDFVTGEDLTPEQRRARVERKKALGILDTRE